MTTILSSWREPGEVGLGAAWDTRRQGADLRTTLEQGLAACEWDENLMAIGRGSLPNSDGEVELDAAMMDGRDLSAGAVCAVRGICPAISVARLVLEKTPHVMLAGDQARRFAIENGMHPVNLHTEASVRKYDEWRAGRFAKTYVHTATEAYEDHSDTVTMLAVDETGHTVAASSTSGLSWKIPGRVGDSPIVGAGVYADDEVGCAGATGLGEELWKACASFRTVEHMRSGMSPQEACDATVRQMVRRQPRSLEMMCVVMALNKDGSFGASTTTGEFPMWICRDGERELRLFGVPT